MLQNINTLIIQQIYGMSPALLFQKHSVLKGDISLTLVTLFYVYFGPVFRFIVASPEELIL